MAKEEAGRKEKVGKKKRERRKMMNYRPREELEVLRFMAQEWTLAERVTVTSRWKAVGGRGEHACRGG